MSRRRHLSVAIAGTVVAIVVVLLSTTVAGRDAAAMGRSVTAGHHAGIEDKAALPRPAANSAAARSARASHRPVLLPVFLGALGALAALVAWAAATGPCATSPLAFVGRRHARGPPLLA